MHDFTLSRLAELFNQYNENNKYDSDKCEHYKNEWILENKGLYRFEPLSESLVSGLRPYLKCWILSIYEYLATKEGVETEVWFDKYKDVRCSKKDNDYYLSLKELYTTIHGDVGTEELDKSFELMLDKSIEPFKSRGIPRTCLDDSV